MREWFSGVPPVDKLPEQIRYFPWTSILYVAVVAPQPGGSGVNEAVRVTRFAGEWSLAREAAHGSARLGVQGCETDGGTLTEEALN